MTHPCSLLKSRRETEESGLRASLAIIPRPTKELHLDPANPRQHSDKQIKQIAASIRAFSFNVPVLIDSAGKVIAGHGRVAACKLLGIEEVPTIQLDHLTPAQAKAFMIADNKLTDNSTWDEHLLAEQMKMLSELDLDFSIEDTGFEMGEIDVLIEGLEEVGSNDEADQLPKENELPAISKTGDLWLLGKHRMLCGNALSKDDFAILMDDKRASAIFIDPPYNVPINGNVGGLGRFTIASSRWLRAR